MQTADTNSLFALHRVDGHTWLIQDLAFPTDDARRVVACIQAVDDSEVEAVWLRQVPLPARYATATDALSDVQIWARRARGGTRPIPIPHFAPRPHEQDRSLAPG